MARIISSMEEFRAFIDELPQEERDKIDKLIMDHIDLMVWQNLAKKVQPPPLKPQYTYTGDFLYKGIDEIRIFGPTPFSSRTPAFIMMPSSLGGK